MPLSHVPLTFVSDLSVELAASIAKAGKAPEAASLDNGDCHSSIHLI